MCVRTFGREERVVGEPDAAADLLCDAASTTCGDVCVFFPRAVVILEMGDLTTGSSERADRRAGTRVACVSLMSCGATGSSSPPATPKASVRGVGDAGATSGT